MAPPDAAPAADGGIDIPTAREAAVQRAHRLWGGNPVVQNVIPVFDAVGKLVAYDVDLALEPGPWSYAGVATEWQEVLNRTDGQRRHNRFTKDAQSIPSPVVETHRFGYVTVSANFDAYPIQSAGRCVSNYYASAWVAQNIASQALSVSTPRLVAAHWLGPLERAYRFEANGKEILVEGQEPWGWYDYETYLATAKTAAAARMVEVENSIAARGSNPQETLDRFRSDNRAALSNVLQESNAPLSTHYIPGYNTSFEPFEWHYGCAPTAGAMVLNYWDNASWYGKLNQSFCDRHDAIEGDDDCHVATLQHWLASFMHTDASGSTDLIAIYPGMKNYANYKGYNFAGGANWVCDYPDSRWNDIVSEINAGYPFVWSSSNYDGLGVAHSVAAVGYDDALYDVLVYSTWRSNGSTPHHVYHSPGINGWTAGDAPRPGGLTDMLDVKLIQPDGYQGFGSCGSTGILHGGDTTTITWTNFDRPGYAVELYYSTDGGTAWTKIDDVGDTGWYIWSIPNISTTQGRIAVNQCSSQDTYTSNDGSYGDFTIGELLSMSTMAGGTVHPASGLYTTGQVVQISATADSGYYFAGWIGGGSGSYMGSNNPAEVTLNDDVSELAVIYPWPRATFGVDMKGKMKDGTFRPDSGDVVTIRGSFNDWGNSTNNPDTLRDADLDSIYTKQIPLRPDASVEYKFWKTPRGSGMGWEESIANRQFTVGKRDTLVGTACFNDECVIVHVWFAVDMRTKFQDGTFCPDSGDVVTVRGSFNDWGNSTNNPDTLVRHSKDSIYIKMLRLAAHTLHEYKFWKTPRGGGMGWEEGIANRQTEFGSQDLELPLVDFNNEHFPVLHLRVNALLQGPHAENRTMTKLMNTAGVLASHFGAQPFPADAVDSIAIEIRNADVESLSTIRRFAPAWLLTDCSIRKFSDTARTMVDFDSVPFGQYYIVVRHRNHLAVMSSAPYIGGGNTDPVTYDFTKSLDQYYHHIACLLSGKFYGLYAGDADGSGDVGALDRSVTWNLRNQTGYLNADVDLSGDVGALDRSTTWNNRNAVSKVP
jgi:hypothetical protein